jgi:hypothetical protein
MKLGPGWTNNVIQLGDPDFGRKSLARACGVDVSAVPVEPKEGDKVGNFTIDAVIQDAVILRKNKE